MRVAVLEKGMRGKERQKKRGESAVASGRAALILAVAGAAGCGDASTTKISLDLADARLGNKGR
jgi:hypothetical protein